MAIMFRGGRDRNDERGGERFLTQDPVALPQQVLNRHRARILEPQLAATYAGAPVPHSTIYRSAVLQLPNSFLRQHGPRADESPIEMLNRVLARIGYRLATERVPPLPEPSPDLFASRSESLPDVQRRVPLDVTAGSVARPLDAWEALQTLRAAAASDSGLKPVVEQVELEHLLVGHTTSPDTSTEGHPDTASYVEPGKGGRTPVDLIAAAPPTRRSISQLGGRRPVIAVLDTGVGTNPWLDMSSDDSKDTFVLLDAAMQVLVAANETGEPEILAGTMDAPVYDSAITRGLNTHSGHGSFIAGIIRQCCPDAKVRSIRVMHDDGIIYENDLQMVLWNLLLQIEQAQADPAAASGFVDVISLSAGYYSEGPVNQLDTWNLIGLLTELTKRGVMFVASAGNDSTDRECFPAALSQTPSGGALPLALAVGALNPNGSKAFFSNDGPWVDYWATGAAVLSTLPTYFDGSATAQYSVRTQEAPGFPQRRQTLDPDDFRAGFAIWSGTSFSAPFVAAELARGLIVAGQNPHLSLTKLDAHTARTRAGDALSSVPDYSVPK